MVNQRMLCVVTDGAGLTIVTVNVWFISHLHLTTNAAREKERRSKVKYCIHPSI